MFLTRNGTTKTSKTIAKQYSAFILRELGLVVHPHLLRHYAGMMWLNALPGEYQGLSKLLGHRSTKTTEQSYTGAETATAQGRWHTVLNDARSMDRAKQVALRILARKSPRGEAA